MTRFLFVYGTLLPGLTPTGILPLLAKLRELGSARLSGLLFDLGSYPCIIIDPQALVNPREAMEQGRFDQVWQEALAFLKEAAHLRGAAQDPGKQEVRGVLYELPADPAVLESLDAYEGYVAARRDNLFERLLANVKLERRETAVPALVYVFPRFPNWATPVPSGDYRAHGAAKKSS